MGKESKKPDVVIYVRIHAEDYVEFKRRAEATGAPISAQIRILVHEAVQKGQKGKVIR